MCATENDEIDLVQAVALEQNRFDLDMKLIRPIINNTLAHF